MYIIYIMINNIYSVYIYTCMYIHTYLEREQKHAQFLFNSKGCVIRKIWGPLAKTILKIIGNPQAEEKEL